MTTTLSDLMDLDQLEVEIADGYVNRRFHPTEPLAILNYTPATQYAQRWTDVTKQTRGLIYNTETLEIVARPWPKFFAWDDSRTAYPPVGPMLLATKYDGSMGVVYREPNSGNVSVASRGSFTSDQAVHATKRLQELLDFWLDDRDHADVLSDMTDLGKTYLLEIIYPENRIVVDYKGEDRLVLLDVIDNETGKQDVSTFDEAYWLDKAEKTLIPEGFSHNITALIPPGEEGFVLSWPERGVMVKTKSAEYVELHRIVTGLSKKTVWEALGRGAIAEMRDNVPDELYGWFDETVAEFHDKISAILDQAQEDYDQVYYFDLPGEFPGEGRANGAPAHERRSAFARLAQKYPETKAYLFKLWDNADPGVLWNMAWKTVKPVGDSRVWNQSEDVA